MTGDGRPRSRSVWSACSLLPLWGSAASTRAAASCTHSKRFALQEWPSPHTSAYLWPSALITWWSIAETNKAQVTHPAAGQAEAIDALLFVTREFDTDGEEFISSSSEIHPGARVQERLYRSASAASGVVHALG